MWCAIWPRPKQSVDRVPGVPQYAAEQRGCTTVAELVRLAKQINLGDVVILIAYEVLGLTSDGRHFFWELLVFT
jgi:hypothetical protein